MRNVLLTGATGAIGPSVTKAFFDAGYNVRILAHCKADYNSLPSVQIWQGDVTDTLSVESALVGIDAVVHMAALLHIINPPPELRTKYEHVNIRGTQIVVEAARKAKVRRIVFFSTIAVYGYSHGLLLNEGVVTNLLMVSANTF